MSQSDAGEAQEVLAPRRATDVVGAARILNATPWMVRELIRTRKLRSVRCGRLIRIPMDALDDFLSGAPSDAQMSRLRKRRLA